MSDNEVLDAVRETLSGVQMDRPIESIVQRGRVRRRVRYGVAAGALAFVAGTALAVPAMTSSGASSVAADGPASSARLEAAAWTVEVAPDNTVRVTLRRADFLDTDVLEKKLADANVRAVVKTGPPQICGGNGGPEPKQGDLSKIYKERKGPGEVVAVITPAAIPAGSHLIFAVSSVVQDTKRVVVLSVTLAPSTQPVTCRPVNVAPR